MKQLEILKEITDFNGNTVAYIGQETMKVRDVLMQQVGSLRSQDGKKTLEAYALGLKITQHKEGPLELEEAEMRLLKEIVTANPAQMAVVAHGPVLLMLQE